MGIAGGNDFSHAATRIFDIPTVAWDNMNVKMKNSLAGRLADIGPDVITVGA